MKNLRTAILCVTVTLYSLCSSAQTVSVPINEPDYNKPKLFQNLPDNIPVTIEKLNSLLTLPLGRGININLSENEQFQFAGTVVSKVSKYENQIQTVVIRSTNYNGATFAVSKITATDGTISYTGRILSFQNGDLFELQPKDGQFVLVKRKFYDLVNE